MTTYSAPTVCKSTETVCNNTTRNCVVQEYTIPGKVGYPILISKVSIDISNEKDGNLSTCYITAESGGNEKVLGRWQEPEKDFIPSSAVCDYIAADGVDVKIRVYLKTMDKSYAAFVKNLKIEYQYQGKEGSDEVKPEPDKSTVSGDVEYFVVKCPAGKAEELIEEIKKHVPAEINILKKSV